MRKMGDKKTRRHMPGHQDCGICHPPVKNSRAKGRRLSAAEDCEIASHCTSCKGEACGRRLGLWDEDD